MLTCADSRSLEARGIRPLLAVVVAPGLVLYVDASRRKLLTDRVISWGTFPVATTEISAHGFRVWQ